MKYNKEWVEFEELCKKCYLNMDGAKEYEECWMKALELLLKNVLEERKKNPEFALSVSELDWTIEDSEKWVLFFLDKLYLQGNMQEVLQICERFLEVFVSYEDRKIILLKMIALRELGQKKELVEFVKKCMEVQPENNSIAIICINAYMSVDELEKAEEIVDKFISDKAYCSVGEGELFQLASELYEKLGKEKEKEVIDQSLAEYEKKFGKYAIPNKSNKTHLLF